MGNNVTRRNFFGAAAGAGALTLAACANNNGTASEDGNAAPDASAYPIDVDGDDVKALWTSEETRDGWIRVTNPNGAVIGVMDKNKIIQVDGLAFKDLDGNGKLDLYEDWRQTADDRAKDLASRLSDDDCIKLMFHGGVADKSEDATDPDFGLIEKGSVAGVSRLASDKDSYASDIEWINTVQGRCEKRPFGIPYMNSTDPYSSVGIPTGCGLAPLMDKDLWRKAGMWTSRAWRYTGVTVELGPQVDLYTNPTVKRLAGAESEDPALTRDFVRAYCAGMQSSWGDNEATEDLGWGSESVATMLKHYVGAGAIETGCNDHVKPGKYDVFEGDNYDAHLIPFLDGGMNLDSTTGEMASVMPNYGVAYSEDEEYGPLVGGGFNGKQLSILRNAGWDGMICSDWNIIGPTQRGLDDLTEQERLKVMYEAGVDQYGGKFYPESHGKPAFDMIAEERGLDEASKMVHESARRIVKLMMNVQLFDQPYCDRSVAKEFFESEETKEGAQEIADKCIIMLKNAGGAIAKDGMASKPKVYIPRRFTPASAGGSSMAPAVPAHADACIDETLASEYFDVVTDSVGDPTGEADESGAPQLQESDIAVLGSDDLSDVEYAIVRVKNPQDAFDGYSGNDEPIFDRATGGPIVWRPVSLQYRPYTADGPSVKKVSVAGDILEDGSKENRAHFGASTYATNESDLDFVISVRERLPKTAKLILIIDANHPMVMSEIEPYADTILMGWNEIPEDSFLRVISGKSEPYGLLQYQMPKDMDTVEAQLVDVPRDMDPYVDSEGNAYDFCFGLNWSGVIDDDRTKTYKVAPLTEPETEVKPDKA